MARPTPRRAGLPYAGVTLWAQRPGAHTSAAAGSRSDAGIPGGVRLSSELPISLNFHVRRLA